MQNFNPQFSKIGDILVHNKILNQNQLEEALSKQKESNEKLGLVLINLGFIDENDLISAFKFLNKDSNDFINFLKNKKSGWRYFNINTQTFFWFKYSANSLMTYKESKNFDKETLNFISKEISFSSKIE